MTRCWKAPKMHDCHVISQTKPVPIPISSENFPGKDPERG